MGLLITRKLVNIKCSPPSNVGGVFFLDMFFKKFFLDKGAFGASYFDVELFWSKLFGRRVFLWQVVLTWSCFGKVFFDGVLLK